ncbi:MAG: M20/M25/M40 family metallo-hydrolase [Candidatus Zixiibacteriota bacterium]
MKQGLLTLAVLLTISAVAAADDLYKVNLFSPTEAQTLTNTGVEPLLWVDGGYLVLADEYASARLENTGLDFLLLASSVSKERLALDGRFDDTNTRRYPVLYETQGIRLLLIDSPPKVTGAEHPGLVPLLSENVTIEYHPTHMAPALSSPSIAGLDTLVDKVSPDSLLAYVAALQSFPGRWVGTVNNHGARDWLYHKFRDIGYDSVVIDTFVDGYTGYNVVAYKPGTIYPERQVVVGGHFDAVSNSPGADDNGSGTAGVLEVARVLKDLVSPATLVFIAFDAEEAGLVGAHHFASTAYENGDRILLMQNMDMIGNWENDYYAAVHYGPEDAYAQWWNDLGQKYAGITGIMSGGSARSDHYAFQQNGYDVCFCIEEDFSNYYHSERDSIQYISFDYMTRMVKASLATVYGASQGPEPTTIKSLVQVGDGQSVVVSWEPIECYNLDHYRVGYYRTDGQDGNQYVDIIPGNFSATVDGLTEGVEHAFYVQAVDKDGFASVPYYGEITVTPSVCPDPPENVLAMPLKEAIRVTWERTIRELDLDHYVVYRDGDSVGIAFDTIYIDGDPIIGLDFHSYVAAAVDLDGNRSDTTGLKQSVARAGLLDENRILAVNRTCRHTLDYADEAVSREFLFEALDGYDFDYYSDTAATTDPFAEQQFDLIDMIDYGTMVIAAEAGRYDDIGLSPIWNGIIDTLSYYVSMGGRLIIFGRWGDKGDCDTIDYMDNYLPYDDSYHNVFHIERRTLTPTYEAEPATLVSDLVGAHSLMSDYPDLPFDSALTLRHSSANYYTFYTQVGGVACATFVDLTSDNAEVIYTYDSRDNIALQEGKPVAWRYLGEDYRYVWFDIPLSAFDRTAAVNALRQALADIAGESTDIPNNQQTDELPGAFVLHQNHPNPFNPNTIIEYQLPRAGKVNLTVFNLLGQKVRTLVDEQQSAGTQKVNWDGANDAGHKVATGLYLYRLQVGDHAESRKMLLLK